MLSCHPAEIQHVAHEDTFVMAYNIVSRGIETKIAAHQAARSRDAKDFDSTILY